MVKKDMKRFAGILSGVLFGFVLFTAVSNGFPALQNGLAVFQDETVLADTASSLQIEDGHAIVAVNAPDGPTLDTRKALEQARGLGLKSLTIRLQMTGLIQDEELMTLIRQELADIAGQFGFAGENYRLVECPEVCK